MRTRPFLLLALPLLLLLPLGGLKWRADQRKEWQDEHPPLSKLDKEFHAAAQNTVSGANSQITILGDSQLTGAPRDLVITHDREAVQELAATLRCDDTLQMMGKRNPREALMIVVTYQSAGNAHQTRQTYSYWRTTTGSYVTPNIMSMSARGFRVRTRFAPRFEALLTRWVQRAKDGQHPHYALWPLFHRSTPLSDHIP